METTKQDVGARVLTRAEQAEALRKELVAIARGMPTLDHEQRIERIAGELAALATEPYGQHEQRPERVEKLRLQIEGFWPLLMEAAYKTDVAFSPHDLRPSEAKLAIAELVRLATPPRDREREVAETLDEIMRTADEEEIGIVHSGRIMAGVERLAELARMPFVPSEVRESEESERLAMTLDDRSAYRTPMGRALTHAKQAINELAEMFDQLKAADYNDPSLVETTSALLMLLRQRVGSWEEARRLWAK